MFNIIVISSSVSFCLLGLWGLLQTWVSDSIGECEYMILCAKERINSIKDGSNKDIVEKLTKMEKENISFLEEKIQITYNRWKFLLSKKRRPTMFHMIKTPESNCVMFNTIK